MNPRTNPFHAEAEIEHFVAYRGIGRTKVPVGRISVTLDTDYMRRYGPYAFFGHFESIDDSRVAGKLLATSEKWARSRQASTLTGPYSYSAREELGLLVSGFDEPPTLLQPHNPPHYPRLLEAHGYVRRFDTACYRWRRGTDDAGAERLRRRAERVHLAGRVRIRPPDMSRYSAELETLRLVYNDSFHDHPEHVSISRPVFAAMAADLRSIVDPNLIRIIEVDDVVAGFLLLVPDLNQVVGRTGRMSPALLARLIGKQGGRIRGIDTAVVVMIGAAQSQFGAGVGRLIASEMAQIIAASPYREVATTWVHEANLWSNALVAQMKQAPAKRYRVYRKDLG